MFCQSEYIAVGIGAVDNIEAIQESDFETIPSLDFPYNDYFDKAYLSPKTNKIFTLSFRDFLII